MTKRIIVGTQWFVFFQLLNWRIAINHQATENAAHHMVPSLFYQRLLPWSPLELSVAVRQKERAGSKLLP